jgi:hypothetical protein
MYMPEPILFIQHVPTQKREAAGPVPPPSVLPRILEAKDRLIGARQDFRRGLVFGSQSALIR